MRASHTDGRGRGLDLLAVLFLGARQQLDHALAWIVLDQREVGVEEQIEPVDPDAEDTGKEVVAELVYDDEQAEGDDELECLYEKCFH